MAWDKTISRTLHNREHPFTRISNALVNDLSISAEARDLLIYLLSQVDHWVLDLENGHLDARYSRYKAHKLVNELIDAGYIERKTTRKRKRIFAQTYLIHEVPVPPEKRSKRYKVRDRKPSEAREKHLQKGQKAKRLVTETP